MDVVLVKEVVGPLLTIIISIILYILVKKVIYNLFKIKIKRADEKKQKTLRNLIINLMRCLFIIVDVVIILEIYGIDTKSLIASLGVVGLVLGLSLQDFLKDFISGMSIILENQYSIGDTITINDFKGEVIEIGLKTTKIKAVTGEIMITANRNISEVINYSIKPSLAIVDVPISYKEDLLQVEQILQQLCDRLSKELKDIVGPVELLGINKLNESSVDFKITVETKSMQHYTVQRAILKEVKLELDKNNIEIPYQQMVIHNA